MATQGPTDIPERSGHAPAVRLAIVGDLLLTPGPGNRATAGDVEEALREVRPLLAGCDIVLGNLECCLEGDGARVETEPRVIGTPELVRGALGGGVFHAVSLANNHAFDCREAGFLRLRGLIEGAGVAHFGAGMDLEEACRPAVLERRGLRIALLGAVSPTTGPNQFAGSGRPGVAPLDAERIARTVRDLRPRVDHVVVFLHWGDEYFRIPSPAQVEQARSWVEAGASVVAGHHPHVLQGMELHRGCPIAYSLGNFLTANVYFDSGDANTWDRAGRTGCILLADLTPGGVANVRQVPTFDDGRVIRIDGTAGGRAAGAAATLGERLVRRANRAVERGVTPGRYRRERLWIKTLRPILDHLRWSRLRHLRVRHFRRALRSRRRSDGQTA